MKYNVHKIKRKMSPTKLQVRNIFGPLESFEISIKLFTKTFLACKNRLDNAAYKTPSTENVLSSMVIIEAPRITKIIKAIAFLENALCSINIPKIKATQGSVAFTALVMATEEIVRDAFVHN